MKFNERRELVDVAIGDKIGCLEIVGEKPVFSVALFVVRCLCGHEEYQDLRWLERYAKKVKLKQDADSLFFGFPRRCTCQQERDYWTPWLIPLTGPSGTPTTYTDDFLSRICNDRHLRFVAEKTIPQWNEAVALSVVNGLSVFENLVNILRILPDLKKSKVSKRKKKRKDHAESADRK